VDVTLIATCKRKWRAEFPDHHAEAVTLKVVPVRKPGTRQKKGLRAPEEPILVAEPTAMTAQSS
jgi:hypothetical protein